MIDIQSPVDLADLMERFGGFHDALLEEVHLLLPASVDARSGTVKVLALEQSAPSGDPWRIVSFAVAGLSAYRLTEGPATYQVLSDGLKIHFLSRGRCMIDLAPYTDAVTEDESLLLKSRQYLIGTTCACEVSAGDI
jgi:hypothetical protein